MRRDGLSMMGWLIMLAVVCSIWGGVYSCSKASCEERGGHIEWVYGGRSGWTCDGADR